MPSYFRTLRRLHLPALLLTCFSALGAGAALSANQGRAPAPRYRPDAVLVAFRGEASLAARRQAVSRLGLGVDPGSRNANFAVLKLGAGARAAGTTVQSVLAVLRRDPTVRIAEPDFIVAASSIPNDPDFPQLYGLHNTGQSGGIADADIDAPEAWDVTVGSKNTVVAVIDTGVDYNHPDLAFNILRDADGNVIGYDFANDDPDPMDDNSHGTHVSGTIGARGNNGIGVVGVNHVVRIMPMKFLSADGFGFESGAISSIDFALAHGARIMSNSWGGGGRSQLLLEAILRARAAGVLFVAAAGNEATDLDDGRAYPASFNRDADNVIAVAATDNRDELAGFSNFGANSVEIAAPGVDVLSTTPDNTYSVFSGTSMATPHVSGAAALVLSRFPGLTLAQLKARLRNSADVVPSLVGKVIHGRLNAAAALENDSTAPAAPGGFTATHRAESGLMLTWTAPGDDGMVGRAGSFELRYSTQPITDGTFSAAAAVPGLPLPGAPGSASSVLIGGLDPDRDYYVALRAVDNVGNASALATAGPFRTLPAAETCYLEDNVEGALQFSGWTVTTEDSFSPTHSYTDSPGAPYAPNQEKSLTQTAPVPVRGAGPRLTFRARTDLEFGADIMYVEVLVEGEEAWSPLLSLTGTSGWSAQSVSLTRYLGQRVRIRFRLASDESVEKDGVWLDDIRICAPNPNFLLEDQVEGAPQFTGDRPWGVTNEQYVSPTHSYTDSPGVPYANFADTSLTLNAQVSLAGVVPRLQFDLRTDLEAGYDGLFVEAAAEGEENWTLLLVITGAADWRTYDVPLSRFFGRSVRVRFHLLTDSSVQQDGVWIDNVRVFGDALAPVAASAPAAPTNLQAAATSPSSIRLTWNDNSSTETGFLIERREDGIYVPAGSTAANSTTFDDTGLRPNQAYRYRVRATLAGLNSAYSNEADAITQAAPAPPAAPSGLTARAASASQIRLEWRDNSTTETGFEVERKAGTGEFRLIEVLAAGTTSLTDSGLASATAYVYRVRAVNAGGASAYTAEASAQTATPEPPGTIKVSATEINFGVVEPGRRARKRLVIKNVGRGVLVGNVGAVRAPFSLLSGGGDFRIPRGKSRTVVVQYAPSEAGVSVDSLLITSNDPNQGLVFIFIQGGGVRIDRAGG